MLYNLPQMHLKKFQEKQFKKLLKQLGTLLVIKLAIKLQKSQKLHHIIQMQLTVK